MLRTFGIVWVFCWTSRVAVVEASCFEVNMSGLELNIS